VQDIQQLFLSGPSQIRYSFVIASLVMAINNDTPFYINGRGRLLCTIDDGSVFIDTARFAYSSSAVSALNQCTYVNFANKIKNAGIQSNLSTSNTVTVNDTSGSAVTLTVGSAGGNNINENHNTRPEILLALLSNGGVGNAIRYSSSTSSINFYHAIRFGTVSEYNIGTIRVNVPTLITI
jgi:hypothetical protein